MTISIRSANFGILSKLVCLFVTSLSLSFLIYK